MTASISNETKKFMDGGQTEKSEFLKNLKR